jgi:mono/diheme cytochrome c family protein
MNRIWVPLIALAATSFAAAPTYTKDVAPILSEHCATCHRAGEIGPMSLLTYQEVRPWAKAIRGVVAQGKMPPWHATQDRGVFSNDRRLSEQDRATLLAWADAGAPQGNPKDMPAAPKFTEGWEIGTPDAVLSMGKPFDVKPEGTIQYQY